MKLASFSERLGRLETSYPGRVLAAALVISACAGFIASGLKFDSSYEALLPRDAPEIQNVDDIRARTGGTRQIVLALSGGSPAERVAHGHRMAARLRDLDGIRAVDVEFPVDFFRERGLWLMEEETLDELVPAVEEAVKIAKWQANPMHLHLDEEAERAELEAAWKKVDEIAEGNRENLPFEEVLTSDDGEHTFVLIVPNIKFSDMKAGRELLSRIHAEIDKTKALAGDIRVRTAGNLDVMQEQHATMTRDLRLASIIALVLGTLIVAAFTRSVVAPLLIGIPLLAGITWTFAMARLFIGHVNIITGFLVAVLIGLGIDFGVHIFIRYQQELRTSSSPREAATKAVRGTLPPALTSALTTAGTFLSFVVAEFRGFSEFGLIAGAGVLATLIASFTLLPPLLVLSRGAVRTPTSAANPHDQRARAIGPRAALPIIAVVIAAAVYGLLHISNIPFRNNFRLLRGESKATVFLDYVDANLGVGFNPAVFLVNSVEEAASVAETARAQREDTLPGGKSSRIGSVFSIADLVPSELDRLRGRIEKLREVLGDPKLDRAEKKQGKRAEQLAFARKMVKAEPWTAAEIPAEFRRRLTSTDGKEFLVFVWPKERNDADYQAAAWEDELEVLSGKLDAARTPHAMADETLIVAWIYRLILADGPPLLLVAALVVLIFLLLDFRRPKDVAFVAFPLAVGMLTFIGLIHALGLELNMFNLIVIPSVIGIGIDNAVHIYHRYRESGPGSVVLVLRTTGMAALLASLTTAVGFGSSLVSHNEGLKSLGVIAVLGIASTFVAATIFFPCVLSLIEKTGHVDQARPPK